MTVRSFTAPQLHARMAVADPPVIVDVREPWEHARCALPGALLIPMGQVPSRLTEIPRDRELILVCHHGVRSLQVAHFLERQGYQQLVNLTGGIDAWARLIDPAMPVY